MTVHAALPGRNQLAQLRHDTIVGVRADHLLNLLDGDCRHESQTGDEGPVADLPGGGPIRWRCDGCGATVYDDAALARLRQRIVDYDDEIDTVAGVSELIESLRADRRDALIDWRYAHTLLLNLRAARPVVPGARVKDLPAIEADLASPQVRPLLDGGALGGDERNDARAAIEPSEVEGLCHWVRDYRARGGVASRTEADAHRRFHFGDIEGQLGICPYWVVAAVMRGQDDPRNRALDGAS